MISLFINIKIFLSNIIKYIQMIDLTSKDLWDQLSKKIDFENGKKKIKFWSLTLHMIGIW